MSETVAEGSVAASMTSFVLHTKSKSATTSRMPNSVLSVACNLYSLLAFHNHGRMVRRRENFDMFDSSVISYEYDCILEQYTQLEFGNFQPTLNSFCQF